MDCRDYGGIINIMWNENITFYGQKDSSVFPNCSLTDDSCRAPVTGTGMSGRLQELCSGQVRCRVELEQTWAPEICGLDTINYMEVTYMCFQPGKKIKLIKILFLHYLTPKMYNYLTKCAYYS